jgi:hypothetical protein
MIFAMARIALARPATLPNELRQQFLLLWLGILSF